MVVSTKKTIKFRKDRFLRHILFIWKADSYQKNRLKQ